MSHIPIFESLLHHYDQGDLSLYDFNREGDLVKKRGLALLGRYILKCFELWNNHDALVDLTERKLTVIGSQLTKEEREQLAPILSRVSIIQLMKGPDVRTPKTLIQSSIEAVPYFKKRGKHENLIIVPKHFTDEALEELLIGMEVAIAKHNVLVKSIDYSSWDIVGLSLSGCTKLTEKGIQKAVQWIERNCPSHWRYIDLSSTNLDDKQLDFVSQNIDIDSFHLFDLSGCKDLTDAGLGRFISRFKYDPTTMVELGLRELLLGWNTVEALVGNSQIIPDVTGARVVNRQVANRLFRHGHAIVGRMLEPPPVSDDAKLLQQVVDDAFRRGILTEDDAANFYTYIPRLFALAKRNDPAATAALEHSLVDKVSDELDPKYIELRKEIVAEASGSLHDKEFNSSLYQILTSKGFS